MVKKMKSSTDTTSKPADGMQGHQLASSVKESAQQIWLAGMGAFSKAQEEGTKVFEAPSEEGYYNVKYSGQACCYYNSFVLPS